MLKCTPVHAAKFLRHNSGNGTALKIVSHEDPVEFTIKRLTRQLQEPDGNWCMQYWKPQSPGRNS